MKTKLVSVSTLKPGDVIMPPERELRLWMRRHAAENGMSENALTLTVMEAEFSHRDKGGDWHVIRTQRDPEWDAKVMRKGLPFSFHARPWSNWRLVRYAGQLRKAHMDAPEHDRVADARAETAQTLRDVADRIEGEPHGNPAVVKEVRRLADPELWVGVVPDIFGYGMTVAAPSKDAAMRALRAEYKKWKQQLGKHADPTTTFDRSFEEFGGWVSKVEIGKVYYDNFGE